MSDKKCPDKLHYFIINMCVCVGGLSSQIRDAAGKVRSYKTKRRLNEIASQAMELAKTLEDVGYERRQP